jgi:hypothetical protein
LFFLLILSPSKGSTWHLAVWAYELALAAPLPTLPLWIAPEWPVPLDLEATYLDAGRALRLF